MIISLFNQNSYQNKQNQPNFGLSPQKLRNAMQVADIKTGQAKTIGEYLFYLKKIYKFKQGAEKAENRDNTKKQEGLFKVIPAIFNALGIKTQSK
ncbi:MAG TPA: hypothetical protein P5556_03820 [Candidatus Gastranaerophilales bacterium]|nr:hypothetical protein [Candidatus Gastranaerophilales bacterium]